MGFLLSWGYFLPKRTIYFYEISNKLLSFLFLLKTPLTNIVKLFLKQLYSPFFLFFLTNLLIQKNWKRLKWWFFQNVPLHICALFWVVKWEPTLLAPSQYVLVVSLPCVCRWFIHFTCTEWMKTYLAYAVGCQKIQNVPIHKYCCLLGFQMGSYLLAPLQYMLVVSLPFMYRWFIHFNVGKHPWLV